MSLVDELLDASGVHPEWRPLLVDALGEVDAQYLERLLSDTDWLPGLPNLFAAFRRNRVGCQYILFGESPYPRVESANGLAFYDAAVDDLWAETGLSKAVNRATSLRNLVKTMLVAEGLLIPEKDGRIPPALVAQVDKTPLARTIADLFARLESRGFLLFNATPILSTQYKPAQEWKFWQGFVEKLLSAIAKGSAPLPTLILWGKIAQTIDAMPASDAFPRRVSEHPYNLSFIANPEMQSMFASLQLLGRA